MAILQVTLSDPLKAAAEAQAAAAGCRSVDDYIVSLIRADELPPIMGELEREILRGLDSGPAVDVTPQLIDEIKRKARG
ncbi:MAG TPA: hypothetical protein VFE47_21710 [Tepidisphaeraceae bacterium]|jgi:hypothetical protein|nr:hypothetical protein [Tepidisphaeraceae bacterium]